MKIKKIKIKNFQQFKDFSIDLTYPKGHKKEGKPLEKICFIGQSGTGKSTILESIQDAIEGIVNCVEKDDKSFFKEITKTENNNFIVSSFDDNDNETIDIAFEKEILTKESEVTFEHLNNYIEKTDNVLLHLDESISEYYNDIKSISLLESLLVSEKDIQKAKDKISEIIFEYKSKKIIESHKVLISPEDSKFWYYLLIKLINYDNKLSKINTTFANKVDENNFKQLHKALKSWKAENPNPRTVFAEKINHFLNKFSVKIDVTQPWGGGIKVVRTDDTEFSFAFASTGTKRIMLTTLIMFFLDTKNTIILFDEPENSLYPDVQQELVKLYTKLAPEAQFFFATHSPFIASQFEPCERFILKFDKSGFVKAKRGDAPEGVEPNYILLNDFGLETVFTQKGEEKWKEFVELKSKIRFEKDENKKQELMDRYMEIGIKYNFGNNETNNKK